MSAAIPWYYRVEPARNLDVAYLVREGVDKRGKKLFPFETLSQAATNAEDNLEFLRKGRVVGRTFLYPVLSACRGADQPCGSTACLVCVRQFRRAMASLVLPHLWEAFDSGLRAFQVNIVPTRPALRSRQPNYAAFANLCTAFRRTFQRSSLGQYLAAGGVEWDWNAVDLVYEPHGHFVFMCRDLSNLDQLRAKFPRANGVHFPVVVQEITERSELPRALIYCWKHKPERRILADTENRADNGPGPGSTTERKIKVDPLVRERYTGLHWLHRFEPTELMLLQGMKRNNTVVTRTR